MRGSRRLTHAYRFWQCPVELRPPVGAQKPMLTEQLRPLEVSVGHVRLFIRALAAGEPGEAAIGIIAQTADVDRQVQRVARAVAELIVEMHEIVARHEAPELRLRHAPSR